MKFYTEKELNSKNFKLCTAQEKIKIQLSHLNYLYNLSITVSINDQNCQCHPENFCRLKDNCLMYDNDKHHCHNYDNADGSDGRYTRNKKAYLLLKKMISPQIEFNFEDC